MLLRCSVLASVVLLAESVIGPPATDPFAILRPCVSLSASDLAKVNAGKTLAKTLPGHEGEVAVFGTRRISVDGERLVSWIRQIDQPRDGRLVAALGRFADPPRRQDLDRLSIDAPDLKALRDCQISECDLKLSAPEIEVVRREVDVFGADDAQLQAVFREIVWNRLQAYRIAGHGGLAQYQDGRSRRTPAASFASLLAGLPCLGDIPNLARSLMAPPGGSDVPLESFFYWSKDRVHSTTVVSVTHVVIARLDGRGAVVAGKQVFGTHYFEASLNVTAVLGDGPGSPRYLAILNRTDVDVFRGLWAPVARHLVERRLRSELPKMLNELADRLEAGVLGTSR